MIIQTNVYADQGLKENQGISEQGYCGEYDNLGYKEYGYDANVKGVAPGALIVHNVAKPGCKDENNQNKSGYTWESADNYDDMFNWGAVNGALISNNSWWSEKINGTVGFGDYEDKASIIDGIVRDANSGSDIQPMSIIFAAGNNDCDVKSAENCDNTEVRVKGPAVAKNVITVGALENLRCGQARVYDLDENNNKTSRAPSINRVYERSGRGPTLDGRIKPDIVAIGADVLSAQALDNKEYWAFECLDCRLFYDPDISNPHYCCEECASACNYKASDWDNGLRCVSHQGQEVSFCPEDENNKIDITTASWTGEDYMTLTGTSMAAPMVTGAAAIFYQFYNDRYFHKQLNRYPSPALVKAALINGAEDISTQNHPVPYMGNSCKLFSNKDPNGEYFITRDCIEQGWGRLNLMNSTYGPTNGKIFFIEQREIFLGSGQEWGFPFEVINSYPENPPLKITLVWTDAPGNVGCTTGQNNKCLVNDLDLIVTSPSGIIYHGNQFKLDTSTEYNFSKENPSDFDRVNNVENVFINNPVEEGRWEIKIKAAHISGDDGQDFAVVYSGPCAPYCGHIRPFDPPYATDQDPYSESGGILLSWLPPEDWGDDPEVGARAYQVERDGNLLGNPLRSTITEYTDYPPNKNAPIKYRIKYMNSCGIEEFSLPIVAIDNTNGAPMSLQEILVNDNDSCNASGVTISWEKDAGNWNGTPKGYEVWRNGEKISNFIPYGTTSFTDYPPSSNEDFSYQIRYINANNQSSFTIAKIGNDKSLGTIGNFQGIYPENDAQNIPTELYLNWEAAENADYYELYFGDENPPPLYQSNIKENQIFIEGLSLDTYYYWYVKAYNNCNAPPKATETFRFKTTYGDCGTPSSPLYINVADENYCAYTGIKISFPNDVPQWKDGDQDKDARYYQIFRRKNLSPSWQLVATIPYKICIMGNGNPCSRIYIDEDVEVEQGYYYKIRYVNSCGKYVENNYNSSISDSKASPPIPTITGSNENICPLTKVRIETQTEKNNYQWYLNNQVITNATNYFYDAQSSGSYSVSYEESPGCIGTSAPFEVKIVPCPDIVFDSAAAPVQVKGDDDGIIEAGERWQMQVTLKNVGSVEAKDVQAEVEGTDLIIYYNPLYFGSIGAGMTKTCVFEFTPNPSKWYSQNSCGSICSLNLINIKSDNYSIIYQNINNFYSFNVGQEEKYIFNANDINVSINPEENFLPYPNIQTPVYSCNVFYELTGNDTKKCLKVELIKDLFAYTLKNYNSDPTYDATSFYNQKGPGQYKLKVTKATLDCAGQYSSKNNEMVIEKIKPNCTTNIAIFPDQGTTAGGTEVQIFESVGAFEPGATVFFDFSNTCPQTQGTTILAEIVQFIDSSHLKIITPRGIEGAISILVDNPTIDDICQTNAYIYKTLAFTANQVTQDISVIDTLENKIFEPRRQIPFSFGITPLGISYSKRIEDIGRKLYITDFHGGDLYIYDGANLTFQGKITLQEWGMDPPLWLTASDITIDFSGKYGYVTHMTTGKMPEPGAINPEPGGISVVDLINNQVIDVDGNPNTTSEGAPEGITRIHKYILNEPIRFYPMEIEAIRLEKGQEEFIANEKYPGEYAFASGVGEEVHTWYGSGDPCPPWFICDPSLLIMPRPIIVEVIDLNPEKVVLPCSDDNCNNWQTEPNPDYRKVIDVFYTGTDGVHLSFINQGIAYIGEEPRHEIWAVNRYQGGVVRFGYEATGDPANPFQWQIISDSPIPTGTIPTDVKVQKIALDTAPPQDFTYAYITNAGDDSVTVIDTKTNSEISQSPIYQDLQCTELDHYPTSFDTRNVGDFGYSSDFHSNTVSIFNLPLNSMPEYPACKIDVGGAPIRIVVQPVPTYDDIFGIVKNALSFATPTDFTEPPKQSNLIRDWENLHKLQETSANPQAVLSNIDNFQKNVNKWVVNTELKKNINENANLYRTGYILDHPTARQ